MMGTRATDYKESSCHRKYRVLQLEFTESMRAILHPWRAENPHAQRVPRSIRRQINHAVREDNRRQILEYERARLDIEAAVRAHQHNVLIGHRPRVAETPDIWFTRQQQLAQERLAIEQRINAEIRLSQEDRGQAVTALSVAHHAPSVHLLPVYTPQQPSGLHALRARVQAGLSRLRLGLAGEREQRRLEQWEQVHRDRAEQAQRLPDPATTAVTTANSLGLGDFGVWASRDTHEQREERLAQLETTAVDRDARLSALEDVIAALRQDNGRLHQENDRLSRRAANLAEERDHLADRLAVTSGQPDTTDAPFEPTDEHARAVHEAATDVMNPAAGAGKTALAQSSSGTNTETASAATDTPTAGESITTGTESDNRPQPSDVTAANLIATAHPSAGAPQAARPADIAAADRQRANAAVSTADDGLAV